MSWWIGLGLALFFIVLNGFFVAAEFALVKVRDTQLAPLAKRGNASAKLARKVGAKLESYLNATQLGITLASLALGWIGEPALAKPIESLMAMVGIESSSVAHSVAFVLSFTILSMLHILFGELVPKSIGIRRTIGTALFSARLLIAFRFIFLPFLAVMDMLSNAVLRAMGMPPLAHAEGALSEEEIRLVLESDQMSSSITERKRALLVRVLRSADRAVRLAMTPRVDIVVLSLDDPITKIREQVHEHEFSRFPVVRDRDLDQVVGYIHARDLFYSEQVPEKLEPILREPLFVPETATVTALLDQMSSKRVHLAIVVDEYGGTSGLVTLEDLVEEIVGEIQDEFDTEPLAIKELEDGSVRIQGSVAMGDAAAHLGIDLPEEYDGTIGRYVIDKLGRMPKPGDTIDLNRFAVEVASIRRRRIAQVIVRPRGSDADRISSSS